MVINAATNRPMYREGQPQNELLSESRHDFISDGVFAMAGASNHLFLPDVGVTVSDAESDPPCYSESSFNLVEELSKSTPCSDESFKSIAYRSIPKLQKHLLNAQDSVCIETYCNSKGWMTQHYVLSDERVLQSTDVVPWVQNIYRPVSNEDVVSDSQQQAEANAVN